MATESKNVVDRIKDLTLCGICADTLTDARVLPCLHTFCLECLQLAGGERRPYQRMPCPLCRNEFSIPRQGFAGLQKNFLMENLLEMASLPSPAIQEETTADLGSLIPCDVCSDTGPSEDACDDGSMTSSTTSSAPSSSSAVLYCVDCRQNLCRLCSNHHKRAPATKQHRLSDNTEVVEQFRTTISDNVDSVISWMEESSKKKERLTEARTKHLEESTVLENDVTRIRDDAKRVIDSRARLLLEELSLSKQKNLDKFQQELDLIEGHLAILESFMKRCLHAKDAVDDDVICRIGDDMNTTAEDLHLIHKSYMKEQVIRVHVPVKSDDFDEFLMRKDTKVEATDEGFMAGKDHIPTSEVGFVLNAFPQESVKTTGTRNVISIFVVFTSVILAILLNNFIPKGHLVSLQLATKLHESHSVMGVTSMDGHIFILSRSTKSVVVYEAQEPFSLVKQIPIPDIKSPWDIVGSPKTNDLYISDQDNSCIWSVSLEEVAKEGWFSGTGYEHPVTIWLTDITVPHTLSMSKDGGILLLRSGTSSRVEKYHPNSVLEQSIELPADIEDPRHLLETTAGTYIVSYGWSGTQTQGVVELSPDGRVVREHRPLVEWQQLTNPYHLAIDDDDHLFVADFYSNRLLLLVANGDSWDMRTILDESNHAIMKPHRLSFAKGNRLIVVHKDGQTVNIYNATRK